MAAPKVTKVIQANDGPPVESDLPVHPPVMGEASPTPAPAPEPAPIPDAAQATTPAATPEQLRPVDAPEPNPFVLLAKWTVDGTRNHSLRAMEVPGGCLVKSSFAWPGYMGESICFVPGVKIQENKLAPSA